MPGMGTGTSNGRPREILRAARAKDQLYRQLSADQESRTNTATSTESSTAAPVTILQQQSTTPYSAYRTALSRYDKVFNGANQIESIVTYDVVC